MPLISKQEFIAYKEEEFHFESKKFDSANYDLEGWFQSEKYFDIELTKYYFEFKTDLIEKLKIVYKEAFSKKLYCYRFEEVILLNIRIIFNCLLIITFWY